ncbi:hypothetical protein ABT001_27555 [Streptomyces sp. NPDC002793]|uniref:hypothetical protein n=1 Tax=Streptomyces sp. NPDC002793 TaxID=3154432 RepID=UPI00331B500A
MCQLLLLAPLLLFTAACGAVQSSEDEAMDAAREAATRAGEPEVRRALAALDLHPAIRTEVRTSGGRVGVLLSLKGNGFDAQDCLLARVGPGATEAWVPSRIQRMPGEGGCTIDNALDPLPPPH